MSRHAKVSQEPFKCPNCKCAVFYIDKEFVTYGIEDVAIAKAYTRKRIRLICCRCGKSFMASDL